MSCMLGDLFFFVFALHTEYAVLSVRWYFYCAAGPSCGINGRTLGLEVWYWVGVVASQEYRYDFYPASRGCRAARALEQGLSRCGYLVHTTALLATFMGMA